MSAMFSQIGYNGNPNLPKENTPIQWTKDMVREFQKCRNDPVYFIETYGMIVSTDDGLVPFKLYDYQKDILANYITNRNICLNQSRQSGKTSIVTAIILHFAIFNKSKRIAILANKEEQAIEILERIQITFEYLPAWLKGGVKEWNKKTVLLENGTKIVAAASSSSAIRGKSQSMLFIDELAFVPHWDQFSSSVLPTLSSGKRSRLIFASTPNGLNHFYQYCEGAKQDINGFWYKEVPWWNVPGRDEAWKERVLKEINYDMEKFEAEYCCSFLGSSGTLVSGWKLKLMQSTQPIFKSDGLSQFQAPKDGHKYVMTVDTSRGKGLDYSAFQVIDVTGQQFTQVCTFRSNQILPYDYAVIVHRIAMTYNQAHVLVEINDIGDMVSHFLWEDFEYENVLFTESNGRLGKRVSSGFGGRGKKDVGIRTTQTVKSIGCSKLKILVESDKLTIHDAHTIDELSRFSKKGTSWAAEEGCHDDLVMGLVLFSWLSDQDFMKSQAGFDVFSNLKEKDEDEIVPFFSVNGVDDPVQDEFDDINLWGNHETTEERHFDKLINDSKFGKMQTAPSANLDGSKWLVGLIRDAINKL